MEANDEAMRSRRLHVYMCMAFVIQRITAVCVSHAYARAPPARRTAPLLSRSSDR